MKARRRAILGGGVFWLFVASASPATVPTECCVCQDNCPSAGIRTCFPASSESECAGLCGPIGCGAIIICLPAAACADIPFCKEAGAARCADGLDNDANGLLDCAEPSCLAEPGCIKEAPAVAWPAAVGLAGLLGFGGMWFARRRTLG